MKYLILVFVLFTFSTNINQKPIASYDIEPTPLISSYDIETELFWIRDLSISYEEGWISNYQALYYEPKHKQYFVVDKIEETNVVIEELLPNLYTNNSEKIYLLNRNPSDKNYSVSSKGYGQSHQSYYQYKGSLSFNKRVYVFDRYIPKTTYIVTIKAMEYQNIATIDYFKFRDIVLEKKGDLSLIQESLITLETPLTPIISTNQYTDVFEFSYTNHQGKFYNEWVLWILAN